LLQFGLRSSYAQITVYDGSSAGSILVSKYSENNNADDCNSVQSLGASFSGRTLRATIRF
jgi:peptidase E